MDRFKEYTDDQITEGCKKCIIQESNGASEIKKTMVKFFFTFWRI